MIKSYRDLDLWQVAMDLLVSGYDLCRKLPATERYELSAQLRRALISIPSNIAEGNASAYRARYLNHLSIARGSLAEVDTLLEAAIRVEYLTAGDVANARTIMDRAGRMLTALSEKLRSPAARPRRDGSKSVH